MNARLLLLLPFSVCLSVLASCSSGSGESFTETEPPSERIIIVGAGMAGLTAAKYLQNSGFETVVLEARDYVGGRTRTENLAGATVDMGAAWIHGPVNHPAATLADDLGISYAPHDYFATLGSVYNGVSDVLVSAQDSLAFLAHTVAFDARAPMTLETLGPTALAREVIDEYLDFRGLVGEERILAQFSIEINYAAGGEPISELNLYDYFFGEEGEGGSEGDDQVLDGGYKTIVDFMASSLDIRTNSEVVRVRYGSDGVEVQTTDGAILSGAQVIVTVPLGVLKAGSIEFQPALPASKLQAIDRLDMGNLEKVAFVFEEQFWDPAQGKFWLHASGLDQAYPTVFDFTEFAGQPTLLALYYGEFARTTQDTKNESEIAAEARGILSKILGPIPEPEAVFVTDWRTSPFSLGSYSYLPIGATADDMRELAQPLEDRVFFAGEATEHNLYATIDGAMISGMREAIRLGANIDAVEGLESYAQSVAN